VHYLVGVPLLALAINTLDFAAVPVTGLLSSRPMIMLGLWSYSLYLWQQPFYKFVDERGSAAMPMLAAVFGCALASYYIVEKPARAWLNRNW
jgi:peptidoglycan/LPS O-acetylase OafA/YrhL